MVPKCNKIKRRERYHWDHTKPDFDVAFNNLLRNFEGFVQKLGISSLLIADLNNMQNGYNVIINPAIITLR